MTGKELNIGDSFKFLQMEGYPSPSKGVYFYLKTEEYGTVHIISRDGKTPTVKLGNFFMGDKVELINEESKTKIV